MNHDRRWLPLLVSGILAALTACGAQELRPPNAIAPRLESETRAAEPPTLRTLALRRGIRIGVAVAVKPLREDPQYARTIREEFDTVTPENAMKWDAIRPTRERFDFTDADTIVDFARANDMLVRGHTLLWHGQNPDWLKKGEFSGEELRAILREHIMTVVGRYRGRVAVWDVVNEAVDEDEPSLLRNSLWLRGLGPDYLALAFRWAHEADPEARLFYNDTGGEGLGKLSDAIYHILKKLREQGVPVHGVGLQMHVGMHDVPNPEEVAVNIARLAALGLEIHITEMDVQIQKGTGVAQYDYASQSVIYQTVTTACLRTSACKAIVVWGLTDPLSWIPQWTKHPDRPLLFDGDYNRKPAYYGIRKALQQQVRQGKD